MQLLRKKSAAEKLVIRGKVSIQQKQQVLVFVIINYFQKMIMTTFGRVSKLASSISYIHCRGAYRITAAPYIDSMGF